MKIKKRPASAKPVAAPAPAQAAAPTQNPRQFKELERVVFPDMIAFHYWREWIRARDRNDWDFMYQMVLEGSPLATRVGSRELFPELCRRREKAVPGLREGELRKIRLDGPDVATMFRVVGIEDRTTRDVIVERWTMLRGIRGWNMYAVDEVTKPRTEVLEHISNDWFAAVQVPEGFQLRSDFVASQAAVEDITKLHPELV